MQNVYSQAKMFHYHDKLKAMAAGDVTPPIHVRMKPINACNHRCFYCCYRHENLFLGENMDEKDMIPENKMKEIVADIVDCGVRAVTFTGGGEPLIYPFIERTLLDLLEGGIKVAVLTNGVHLAGKTASILAEGASWVRISIDSTNREMLAKSRHTSLDDFDIIMDNIRSFSRNKSGDCELGINFIITEHNASHVFPFIQMMKESGVDHVKVSECVVSTKGAENNEYHERHFDYVLNEIHRAQEALSDRTFQVINKFHDFDDQYQKQYASCPFTQFLNVIAADLRVYTCQDKAYTRTGILGDLSDQSLKGLWESEDYAALVKNLNPSNVCNHHCVSHGKNLALIDYLSTDKRHLDFV